MANRLIMLSLLTTILLLGPAILAAIPRVSAFDPGGPPAGGAAPSVVTGNWEWINYGPTGGSYSPQNQINKDNVQYLEPKWVYPYNKPGGKPYFDPAAQLLGAMAPPIIVDGTIYVAMNDRRILAIDATNGKLLWNNTYATYFDVQKHIVPYPWMQAAPGLHVHAINYYRDKGWLITSSQGSCNLFAIDAKTGKTAWTLTTEQLCGTNAEFGDPTKTPALLGSLGFQGYMAASGTNPPVFVGNIMFFPPAGRSGGGGRSFVTAFDMSDPANPKRLYREWVFPSPQGDPNWAISECSKANGNGWYFEYPRYLEGINYPARDREPTYLATKCTDVSPDVVRNDWIDLVPGSPSFGKVHSASSISPVWGQYVIDQETGIVYLGWGDQGPYTNLTHRYGPGLHGSGFTAHDVRTGKMVWWFNAIPHDLWDYDCSWGGILGQVQGKKAYIKSCKNGIVYALDAATGKPFWVYDNPNVVRGGVYPGWEALNVYYGVGANNRPTDPEACCRMTKADMAKPWVVYPKKEVLKVSCVTECLESDLAYDGKRVYMASFNQPRWRHEGPVVRYGNNGLGGAVPPGGLAVATIDTLRNTNINALDVNTGKQVWTYRIEGVSHRGGISVTGGFVMAYASDGNLKFIDAETGKLLHEKFFGIPVNVMPTVGATKAGKMLVLVHVGGGGGGPVAGVGSRTDGSLIAYGLPDRLPQPQVITKEVIKEVPKEVIKEVVKEVPKEIVKEVIKEVPKEVIKEVPKEIVKEVTVETISPISYAAIGIGVVLVVISGVLFSRRKKA